MPKVSVIVPVFNVEQYLPACLDSILAQSFTDWECILVDDGSNDKSGMICDVYGVKDRRFVVIHKTNEGVAKARITAFEHSQGDLITFVDADDFVEVTYIQSMLNDIEKYHVDMAICQYYTFFQNDNCRSNRRSVQGYYERKSIDKMLQSQFLYDYETRCAGVPITLWAKLVKREYVLNALKVGEGLKWSEDQIGLFYMLNRIKSLYVSDKILYYYVMYYKNPQILLQQEVNLHMFFHM